MNSELVIFAIQSLIKLGNAGKQALEANARSQDILFPDFKPLEQSNFTFVMGYFKQPQHRHLIAGEHAPYKQYWVDTQDDFCPKQDSQSIDALLIAAAKQQTIEKSNLHAQEVIVSDFLVKAWGAENQPLTPLSRIALSAADIALDYVGNNVGIVGGGNGAKLLSAYAKSLADKLPDNGNLSYKHKVYQSLNGVILRAGFETLSSHPQWVVSEPHLSALVSSIVDPLAEAFPLDTDEQIVRFEQLKDTLSGAAITGVMQTLAKHQEAFLGASFSTEKALGALTKSLFENAADIGLEAQFTKQGLLQTFQSCIEVVAQRPELFIHSSDEEIDAIARQLLGNMASVVHQAPFPFDSQVGIAIGQQVLTVVSDNIHKFVEPDQPWQKISADITRSFIQTLTPHLGEDGAIKHVLSQQQLIEMGRIVLTQVAATPTILLHTENEAKSGIVVAIANAMAADSKLLLNGNDWLKIVDVAATEAAANPMRLFKLDPQDPQQVLAGELITLVINSANRCAQQQGMNNVLFGETLTQAISILLKATSGNVQAALDNKLKLSQILNQLNQLVAQFSNLYGAKEWLFLYRQLLQKVLSGIELPQLSVEFLNQLLEGNE